jgi:WhiB family redox-sensing transcriptional regulator
MDTWRDIRAHLEAQDDPGLAAVLAELTPADRQAAGPTWFARMVAQARPKWQRDGLCLEHPELSWFPSKGQPTAPAKAVCSRCLVRPECLAFAIDNDERGVWGGTSEAERRAMRRDQAA